MDDSKKVTRPPLLLPDGKLRPRNTRYLALSAPASPRAQPRFPSPLVAEARNCVTPPPTTSARGVVRFFPHVRGDVAAPNQIAIRTVTQETGKIRLALPANAQRVTQFSQYYDRSRSRSVFSFRVGVSYFAVPHGNTDRSPEVCGRISCVRIGGGRGTWGMAEKRKWRELRKSVPYGRSRWGKD